MARVLLFVDKNVDHALFQPMNKIGTIPHKKFDSREECLRHIKFENIKTFIVIDAITGKLYNSRFEKTKN